jgi:malonyl-CoA/methylmalonyl-CoA synthetase
VIKSGGYKISALDIEKELLAHPQIEDVAIMGMPDQVWGQRVFALIVLKGDDDVLNEEEFKKWCGERLPKYSIPTVIKTISKMPRNMMGKVNKKDLIGKIDTL